MNSFNVARAHCTIMSVRRPQNVHNTHETQYVQTSKTLDAVAK